MLFPVCSYQTVDLDTAELMQPTYMHMAAVLEPFVDILLCETLSSTAEAMAAASAASMSGGAQILWSCMQATRPTCFITCGPLWLMLPWYTVLLCCWLPA